MNELGGMENDHQIGKKLDEMIELMKQFNLYRKRILTFNEACVYLELSKSYLYKLTSSRCIPHFCPFGKKLYFKRDDLDQWIMQNPQIGLQDNEAARHILK